jgi:hypothetical protein
MRIDPAIRHRPPAFRKQTTHSSQLQACKGAEGYGLGQRVGGNAGFLLFRMHWWETAADMAYRPGSIAP